MHEGTSVNDMTAVMIPMPPNGDGSECSDGWWVQELRNTPLDIPAQYRQLLALPVLLQCLHLAQWW